MTFGSLFAGIGGIDLGLERAGMTCAWQSEIDEYACGILSSHWPDVPRHGNVRGLTAKELTPVDLIAGGFPCQDISHAGKRAGLSGSRSSLWWEMGRAIRLVRPKHVLVENVAALLVRGMGTVLGDLAESGYDTEWDCIPAAAVGAPHIRDRIFVVAYADASGRREDIGDLLPRERDSAWRGKDVADAAGTGLEVWSDPEGLRQFAATVGARQWAVEPDVGRVADGVPARVDRLRTLGNAVVPQVAEFIGHMILARTDAA